MTEGNRAMPSKTTVEMTAADDRLTLAEIEEFCRKARAAGATDSDTPKHLLSTWGAKLQGLALDAEPAGQNRPNAKILDE